MDLLATVRKEGSRGGRGDFKWSDVQTSSHRENYLGHSLMAPVGRWQKGRDLNWYAKGDKDVDDGEDPAIKAARERKEEIQRVKQAEEDALARALGLPVAPRNNPNMEELGTQREVGRVLKGTAGDDDAAASRGVGYGRPAGISKSETGVPTTERIEGRTDPEDKELQDALKEYKRRYGDRSHGDQRHRNRSRSHSRDRKRDKEHRRRRKEGHRYRERQEESRRDSLSGGRSLPNARPGRRSQSPSDDRPQVSRQRERRRSRSPRGGHQGDKRTHYDDRRRHDGR